MTEPNNTALLIVDMINNFQFDMGERLAEKTKQIVPRILSLKKHAKQNNWPIIYINDHYGLWKADIDAIREECSNDISADIIEDISPQPDDYFLIKPKHSAFYETALHTLLTELKVNQLMITGIAGNICVLFTANDAYMREYSIAIPKDCTASNNDEDNDFALTMMENVLFAEITTEKQITSEK
ncbi:MULTISPECIES: isochorismatase family cysteine hydrolase [Bacillus]|uniref:Isochorismatase n=2 Tax=Bacillus amyloliquefaciens TaxID=1390 RepID=A0A9P1JDT0_BACAS|nr:isochorismatase family cysteine hydrolase [Bacillus amyloliquefaciens]AEB61573.1 putative isochorismatase [Bacillus amyloliquefaciens LL3]AIW32136.1 isochorismatase [Bacillus subtilis]HBO5952073.1 cysteine hydrolase [Pseudomonas aeruginosa]ARW37186.1 Isochorismatase [Bacillus amyloliquefaciens]AZV91448.1 isochorismatase [Bacillus amyloliquefaciens]